MDRIKKIIPILLFSILSFLLTSPSHSADVVKIGIPKPSQYKKSLMALPPFQFYGSKKSKSDISLGQTLFNTTLNDLTVSSLFRFIDQNAYLEDTRKVGLRPAPGEKNGFDFKKWKAIGTEFLVRGGYRVNGQKISLEVYLYYVPKAKLVFGNTYEGSKKSIRRIAHTFSNDVVKSLTGKKSMFNSRFVVSTTRADGRSKEIYTMDWDGHNPKRITREKGISISPSWSPDGDKIAYTSFVMHKKQRKRNADLFIYEISSGKRWLVSYRKGLNSGSVFFPNGSSLLLTLSRGGDPDIYRIDTKGKIQARLTRGPKSAMNVEPAVSADGKKIAFSSTRGGKPMIYTMDTRGKNIKRLTFAGRYNASPSWSPDGNKIAFAGYDKGHFDIFLINSDGSNLKRLTSSKKKNGKWADNEDPSFSPDGRFITFVSNRTGRNQIYIVNLDGTNERRITFDRYAYFKPKWGPFLD